MKTCCVDTMNQVNPRYVAYAAAHGKTPDEMMERDSRAYPGGCTCGFLLWISQMKQKFWKESLGSFLDRYAIHDQDAWTRFLKSKADKKSVLECV